MQTRVFVWGLLPGLVALCAGCGGSGLVPAAGKVTYKGNPIKGAIVIFHPKDATIHSKRPSAITDADGAFSLTTGAEEGAPPGEYEVTVVWRKEPDAGTKKKAISTDSTPPDLPDELQGKYADPATSKLKATVNSTATTVPTFALE
jgi:hypothetical protein